MNEEYRAKPYSKKLTVGSIVIVLILIAALIPFIIMIIGSLKPNMTFSIVPIDMSPFNNLTVKNYQNVLETLNIPRAFKNSVYILILVVGAEEILAVTAGYVFAVKRFPFKKILFALVIVTMMLPKQLLLVPNFMVAKKLALINSLTGVALTTINASYGIFLTRQFVLSIPKDYYEAARIDGCSEWGIFARIILPFLKPVIAAIAIYSMFSVWNDYLWQNVMLSSESNQTVPLMLAYLSSKAVNGIPVVGLQLAGSVIAVAPVLIFYLIFQRWFIEGVNAGGIKE